MARLISTIIIVLALVMAAGLLLVQTGASGAVTSDPLRMAAPTRAAPPDDEIIVITAAGQLRVDDPYTAPGYMPASWNSGADVGWTTVAGGDFNGDGDAELVAARGSFVKVFDPVVQRGKTPVAFSVDLGDQRNVRLLNTGDFDADGKAEFAVMHYVPGADVQARLAVYDGGTNAASGEWQLRNATEYGAMFQDMSTGDFNADGADDLVMVRNAGGQRLVLALNISQGLTTIAQKGDFCCDWFAVAGGNLSNSAPGDEIALLRDGANATTESLILFRVAAGAFTELVSNPSWRWVPEFISLANGDLNGDGDDEVVMLRDPVNPSTSLHMVNPAGAAMNSFDQATGAGAAAFKIVRTGDVDGDGRAEIVILRGDRYRLYTEPNVDSRAVETTGAFYATGGVSNLPFLAVANVDGAGILDVPTLSVTPVSLSFSLDFDATSPIKPLSITNSGTASSFPWQAQVIEGSDWLLIDASQGTTPGQVNVSVKTTIMPGTYTGQIRISTTDVGVRNNPVEIPVFYTLAAPPTTGAIRASCGWTRTTTACSTRAKPGCAACKSR